MRRRVLVFNPSIIVLACLGAATPADNPSVDLFASTANYSGPCPVDIVFVATLSDDPGTIFGYHFYGGGFKMTKELYGYMPDSATSSEDDDITIDASHAGKITRSIEVTFEKRSPNGDTVTTVKSASADAVVTCTTSAASPTPSGMIAPTAL